MDIIAAIRDILISVYLLAGIVLVLGILIFTYLIYRASKGLIGTVTRTAENFEKVSSSAVEHIAKPLEEGISVALRTDATYFPAAPGLRQRGRLLSFLALVESDGSPGGVASQ